MCSRHQQLPHVIGVGAQWATTNVRQKATVVCEVRGSRSNKRLMYEPRDLEHKVKVKVNGVQQLATSLTATGTHMPYGITQIATMRDHIVLPATRSR